MATLILQVPDEILVSKVKQVCKMLMGGAGGISTIVFTLE